MRVRRGVAVRPSRIAKALDVLKRIIEYVDNYGDVLKDATIAERYIATLTAFAVPKARVIADKTRFVHHDFSGMAELL